ncbi:MAG: hypothetical protein JWQ48_1933 [Conexibacter sp.]|nr:hypothetical protein [Conexibacter sp.]
MPECNMPDDSFDHDFEDVRAEALTLKCPKCRTAPGLACVSAFGRFLPNLRDSRPGLHAERLAQAKERLTFAKRLGRAA